LDVNTNNHQRTKLVRFGLFIFQLLITTIVTFVIASALHTQFVLSGLISVGAEIPLSVRIETIFVDFVGLLPTYGAIIFVGMLIAMTVAVLLAKKIRTKPLEQATDQPQNSQKSALWVYTLAGAVAMFTLLAAMHPILNVSIIAGARGFSGLLTQSIAGAIGGTVFGLIRGSTNKYS